MPPPIRTTSTFAIGFTLSSVTPGTDASRRNAGEAGHGWLSPPPTVAVCAQNRPCAGDSRRSRRLSRAGSRHPLGRGTAAVGPSLRRGRGGRARAPRRNVRSVGRSVGRRKSGHTASGGNGCRVSGKSPTGAREPGGRRPEAGGRSRHPLRRAAVAVDPPLRRARGGGTRAPRRNVRSEKNGTRRIRWQRMRRVGKISDRRAEGGGGRREPGRREAEARRPEQAGARRARARRGPARARSWR
jgi:hypothetical protein